MNHGAPSGILNDMKPVRHRSHPVPPAFEAIHLTPDGARRAFPLARVLNADLSLRDWLAFSRRMTRRAAWRGGIIALTDRKDYIHALYSYRVDRNLALGRFLRISDVVISELPGAGTRDAALASMRRLAASLDCPSLVVETTRADDADLATEVSTPFAVLHRPPPQITNHH